MKFKLHQAISIPAGTIQRQNGTSALDGLNLFQFQQVRFKGLALSKLIISERISIPAGTIQSPIIG